jgi:hypothetical protein
LVTILWGTLVVAILIAVFFLLVTLAARRYAKRQQQLGAWDKFGPLIETEPPPHPIQSGYMSWRLEAVGRWKRKVLRQRKPNEPLSPE